MKCPILKKQGSISPEFEDCIEEKCAWWSIDYGGCIISAFPKMLDDTLADLAEEFR